ALVAWRLRVAERDEDAVVGDVSERRPDLLAVDDVDVSATFDACACGSEVGARVRLGEALAPDLLGGQDLRQVRLLLVVAAVRHDRRPGHTEPDDADVGGSLRARHLLVEDGLEAVRGARAAVLLGPGQPGIAGLVQLAAPVAPELVAEALLAAAPSAPLLGEVRVQPCAQPGPEGCLLRGVADVHEA